MTEWKKWEDEIPEIGSKIVIVCDDGCSTSLAFMSDDGPLDGEDGMELGATYLRGSIWALIPDDYPIAFMEYHDDW